MNEFNFISSQPQLWKEEINFALQAVAALPNGGTSL